jgi:hypothetical protein
MLRASIIVAPRHRFIASAAASVRPVAYRTGSLASSLRALHSSPAAASADTAASGSAAPPTPAGTQQQHTASSSTQNAAAHASSPQPRAFGEKHTILDEMLRVDHAVLLRSHFNTMERATWCFLWQIRVLSLINMLRVFY